MNSELPLHVHHLSDRNHRCNVARQRAAVESEFDSHPNWSTEQGWHPLPHCRPDNSNQIREFRVHQGWQAAYMETKCQQFTTFADGADDNTSS
jgi:hypothetical protein